MRNLNTINIDAGHCYRCGVVFDKDKSNKTKHHSLPKAMKPKFNVTVPVCKDCHRELNNLYINQEKRPKAPKPYKYFANKLEGLTGVLKRFDKKMHTLLAEVNKEIRVTESLEKDDKKL